MISNEPVKNLIDYAIVYDITIKGNKTDINFIKGRKVQSVHLVHLIWNFIPRCYQEMKKMTEDSANYIREELTERITSNAFWTGNVYLKTDESDTDSIPKKIILNGMVADEEHLDLLVMADHELNQNDCINGICSLLLKTYATLYEEDVISAGWLKESLSEMILSEEYWNEGMISDDQLKLMQKKYFNRNEKLS